MQNGSPREYTGLWLRQALSRTWNIGDTISGAIGAVAAVIAHYSPAAGQQVNADLWQVPIWALAATALFRFLFFAPYELWKAERDGRKSLNDHITQLGHDRPFRYSSVLFLFQENPDGSLTNTLTGVEIRHDNTGERPVRYTLDAVSLEIDGNAHDLERYGPTAIVQGESYGTHGCTLPEPVTLDPMPARVRMSYDYRYDTIPPVHERTTGATMRFLVSHESVKGPFFDDQRES